MKKRVLASLLVAAMAVGMMAGCGKSGDKQETTQKTEAKEESSGELTKISVCEPVRGILGRQYMLQKQKDILKRKA